MRRAMFSEPLLAHPAETRRVRATEHPHPGNDDDPDQCGNKADKKQHRDPRVEVSPRMTMLTRGPGTVCAFMHSIRDWHSAADTSDHVAVHLGTAPWNAGAY